MAREKLVLVAAFKDQRECLNYQSHVGVWKTKTISPGKLLIYMSNEYNKSEVTSILLPCLIEESLPPLRSFCLIHFDHTSPNISCVVRAWTGYQHIRLPQNQLIHGYKNTTALVPRAVGSLATKRQVLLIYVVTQSICHVGRDRETSLEATSDTRLRDMGCRQV